MSEKEGTSSQESLPLSQETFRLLECTLTNNQMISILDDVAVAGAPFNIEGSYLNGVHNNPHVTPNPNEVQNNLYMMPVSNEEFSTNSVVFQAHFHQRPSSILPASENWEGKYGFKIWIQNAKGSPWIFSENLKKLYVNSDVGCPFNVSTSRPVPGTASIRASPLFISPEHAPDIVQRCLTHSQNEMEAGVSYARHLVRCESEAAHYEVHPHTSHHSVVIPFDKPPVGQPFSTYLFKFSCKTSCSGGPNRRPFVIVFTLENGGEVIGRQKIDIKVCACPSRDLRLDERALGRSQSEYEIQETKPVRDQAKRSNMPDISDVKKHAKKQKIEEEEESYTITVNNKKCYDFLKGMKKYFVMYTVFKKKYPNPKDFKCLLYSSTSSEDDGK